MTTSVEDCKSHQWTAMMTEGMRGLTIFDEMVGERTQGYLTLGNN
jgi:hypothetical protein